MFVNPTHYLTRWNTLEHNNCKLTHYHKLGNILMMRLVESLVPRFYKNDIDNTFKSLEEGLLNLILT